MAESGVQQPVLQVIAHGTCSAQIRARLTDIAVNAFADDDSFAWRYPRREEYPAHNRALFAGYLNDDLLNPSAWVVAAYLDGQIVGYATWQRKGAPLESMDEPARDCWLQRTERALLGLQQRASAFLFPNPGAFMPAVNLMRRSFVDSAAQLDALPNFATYLHLNVLAVDPAYQRRGVGSSLVTWGVTKSHHNDIPCALESSRAGKKVYMKCGFKEIGICDGIHAKNGQPFEDGMHCEQEGCQFAVGTVMIRRPGESANE
ncbi:hypothetical protein DRE_01572 [Drechslerella stenobrocha 248]|uniref:N-acetyltransferase domain-containing protein n=1 Tax=Drechslerella stenobrocha 248 TaxID=1043628 RepID=W7I4L9_9PEZI|nr:hypothetical protein DRE_01572 [Drechslerella stenobrocha 248]